ncbi:MAG: VOC family protein [Planctomycetota bacterium]|jgi:catechol 2,3-dioxygenase-like lactoylglutathione lyase family enzyme
MITPKQLNAVGIVVRNLQLSLAWYKRKFGFEHLFDVPNGVVIGAGGVELWVAEATNPAAARQAEADRDICIRLIGLEVSEEDFAAIQTEFADADEIVEIDHAHYRSCIIADPDGHAIELFVNKPAKIGTDPIFATDADAA